MTKIIQMTLQEFTEAATTIVADAMVKAERANPEKLFTQAEIADKLGVDRSTVWRMVNSGRLESTADKKYISQEHLNHYLNTKTFKIKKNG